MATFSGDKLLIEQTRKESRLMNKSRTRAGIIVSASAAFGLAIGGAVVAVASEPDQSVSQPEIDLSKVKMPDGRGFMDETPSWPENRYGLTVGTPTEADRISGNLPDLSPFSTDDGKPGYVISKNYYLPDATNPEQAVAQMKVLLNDKNQTVLDVYEADGTTKIGTRLMGEVSYDDEDRPTN